MLRSTGRFAVLVLIHVESPAWRRQLEEQAATLLAEIGTADSGAEAIELVPVELPSREELGRYLLENLHSRSSHPFLVISDQVSDGYGKLSELGKVIRAASFSHERIATFLQLEEQPRVEYTSHHSFLTLVPASIDPAGMRRYIVDAALRLQMLAAPDAAQTPVHEKSEYQIGPVDSPEQLEQCLRLRHEVFGRLGYLEPESMSVPQRIDADCHDSMAIHFAAVHRETGALAGTTRLVVPDMFVARCSSVAGRQAWETLQTHQQWMWGIARRAGNQLRARLSQPRVAALPMLSTVDPTVDLRSLLARAVVGAELSRFIVTPKYRGTGISRALAHLAMAAGQALERQCLFLQCLPTHVGMYRKYGFQDLSGQKAGFSVDRLHASLERRFDDTGMTDEAVRWDRELSQLIQERGAGDRQQSQAAAI